MLHERHLNTVMATNRRVKWVRVYRRFVYLWLWRVLRQQWSPSAPRTDILLHFNLVSEIPMHLPFRRSGPSLSAFPSWRYRECKCFLSSGFSRKGAREVFAAWSSVGALRCS